MAMSKARKSALQKRVNARVMKIVDKATEEEQNEEQEEEAQVLTLEDVTKAVTEGINAHPVIKALSGAEEKPVKKKRRSTGLTTKMVEDIAETIGGSVIDAVKEMFGGDEGVDQLKKLSKAKFVKAGQVGGKGKSQEDSADPDEEFGEKQEGTRKNYSNMSEREFKRLPEAERMDALSDHMEGMVKSVTKK